MKAVTVFLLSLALVFSVNLAGCSGEEEPMDSGGEIGVEENMESEETEAPEGWENDNSGEEIEEETEEETGDMDDPEDFEGEF
ncbi:MAG: hypothetical protein ACQEP7_03205 [bacterium]